MYEALQPYRVLFENIDREDSDWVSQSSDAVKVMEQKSAVCSSLADRCDCFGVGRQLGWDGMSSWLKQHVPDAIEDVKEAQSQLNEAKKHAEHLVSFLKDMVAGSDLSARLVHYDVLRSKTGSTMLGNLSAYQAFMASMNVPSQAREAFAKSKDDLGQEGRAAVQSVLQVFRLLNETPDDNDKIVDHIAKLDEAVRSSSRYAQGIDSHVHHFQRLSSHQPDKESLASALSTVQEMILPSFEATTVFTELASGKNSAGLQEVFKEDHVFASVAKALSMLVALENDTAMLHMMTLFGTDADVTGTSYTELVVHFLDFYNRIVTHSSTVVAASLEACQSAQAALLEVLPDHTLPDPIFIRDVKRPAIDNVKVSLMNFIKCINSSEEDLASLGPAAADQDLTAFTATRELAEASCVRWAILTLAGKKHVTDPKKGVASREAIETIIDQNKDQPHVLAVLDMPRLESILSISAEDVSSPMTPSPSLSSLPSKRPGTGGQQGPCKKAKTP